MAIILLLGFAGIAIAGEDEVVDDFNVTPQFIAKAITQAGGIVTGIETKNMGPPSVNFEDSHGNKYYAIGWDQLTAASERRPLVKNLSPEDRCELYPLLLSATESASRPYNVVFSFWYGTNTTPSLSIKGTYPYDGTNSRDKMTEFFLYFMDYSRRYYQRSDLLVDYFGPMK